MARLPKGWTRLKTIGDVEPVLILVNRDSGKFGTSLDDGEHINECATMAAAEAAAKEINESGAINAMTTDNYYGDSVVRLVTIRVKRVHRGWARMDGTRINEYSTPLMVPDPAAAAAVADKFDECEATKKRVQAIKDEAWEIIKGMKKLEGESGDY